MERQAKYKGSIYTTVILTIFALFAVLFVAWVIVTRKVTVKTLSPFADLIKNGPITAAKTIQNPITGIMYTEQEATSWKDIRPIGVMVNNHTAARPQSGLIDADLVYEMVAEGGITRYLAFFITNSPAKVGPIRSIREYYLVLVKEMGDAMIMHIGWSPQALIAIESWPVRSLIRLGLNCDVSLADPAEENCWRNKARVDSGVPWEHTAYGNLALLRTKGNDAGWIGKDENFKVWKFSDDNNRYVTNGTASNISIDFWVKGDYSANFKYDSSTNTYFRFLGYNELDQPMGHYDQETKKQIEVNNLIVQFATESSIPGDDKSRLGYQLVGSGEAKIFMNGKEVDATWNKSARDLRTMYYDTSGNEIQFNPGKFWICIVPDRNKDQVVIY